MTLSHAAAGGDTADATPQSGIVWIYHFQPDGSAELMPNERVERALADHVGWTWVHLSLADTRCRAWIAQHARAVGARARNACLGRTSICASTCSATRSSAWCPICSRNSRRPATRWYACASS